MGRVHSNIAFIPNRRLPQIYGAGPAFNAVSNSDPNTLNGNRPSLRDAMGRAGQDGIISFIHDYTTGDPDMTCWFWCEILNDYDPSSGWIKASESATGHTKTVPGKTLCSFTVPEGAFVYLQSSVAGVRNLMMGGARKADQNPNPDMAHNAANSA